MMKLFECIKNILIENTIDDLYREGLKYYPKLKVMSTSTRLSPNNIEDRFFVNYPKNKGSYHPNQFKKVLISNKIDDILSNLDKQLLSNLVRSNTTESVYFTYKGKSYRLSDHPKNSDTYNDIIITFNSDINQILSQIEN